MPDLASRRLAKTSWVLLPIDETMPIPVTTTRLMHASSASRCAERAPLPPSTSARLHHFVAEQTDLEVEHAADQAFAVFAAGFRDLGDAVEHEHRRQRQLGVAGAEQLAPRAGQ